MARTPLIRTRHFAYHVTARSNNKDWFALPLNEVWKICSYKWSQAAELYQFAIHSFVLMSNHYHLIISTPDENLDTIMRYFGTEVSKAIGFKTARINHVFGGRYKWSLLAEPYSLAYAFKYVHRNPVRAHLVSRVQDYRYNAHYMDGRKIPIVEGCDSYWDFIPKNSEERLSWLNQPTPKECEGLITNALRRHVFQFSRQNQVRSLLENLAASYEITTPGTFWAR